MDKAKALLRNRRWFKAHRWHKSYNCAKARCEDFEHVSFNRYGGRGIKMLMTPEDFKFIWFRDKASLMKNPSVDRIDNDGNYILENCRYMEKGDNARKSLNKKITQLSMRGKVIRVFDGIENAAKELGIAPSGISMAVNELRTKAVGFRWRFATKADLLKLLEQA